MVLRLCRVGCAIEAKSLSGMVDQSCPHTELQDTLFHPIVEFDRATLRRCQRWMGTDAEDDCLTPAAIRFHAALTRTSVADIQHAGQREALVVGRRPEPFNFRAGLRIQTLVETIHASSRAGAWKEVP